ncbi:hypothetical protein V5O48_014810 [Marasmius crinis-equi]|uniref:UFSP1/2/DUB catalytic domain-containing protein n=1 Tax=Marasmius crinis-equi TaxID=585013 RepID=A0ABR3EWL3_9AGAR
MDIKQLEEQQDVFWHSGMPGPPPIDMYQGMIMVLKNALETSYQAAQIKRAVLCDEGAVFVNHLIWDVSWGARQSYITEYQALLTSPTSPGVRSLQTWIEDAWKAGYDADGCAELGSELEGTSKKLAITDLWTAFVSRGVPAHYFTLNSKTEMDESLSSWVTKYFDQAIQTREPVQSTSRMPVLVIVQLPDRFQHYAIVGYEVNAAGDINLLVFNPTRQTAPGSLSYLVYPTINLWRCAQALSMEVN